MKYIEDILGTAIAVENVSCEGGIICVNLY